MKAGTPGVAGMGAGGTGCNAGGVCTGAPACATGGEAGGDSGFEGFCRSSDASSGLFSCGFTVERMTMNLFKTSNQNGAPRVTASAVKMYPRRADNQKEMKEPAPAVDLARSSVLAASDQPIGRLTAPNAAVSCFRS